MIMDKVKVENFDLKYKVLLKSHKNVDVSTLIVGMLCFSPCVCVWNGLKLHQEMQKLGKVSSCKGYQALGQRNWWSFHP